jgi:hypothetical protein
MKYCLYLLLMSFGFASCTTDLPLPEATGEQKIALLGELAGDDSVLIRGGQSMALSSGGSGPGLIQQLALTIKDEVGVSTVLLEREDYAAPYLFTIPFSNEAMIKPGGTYNISGTHPKLKGVSAKVSVPKAFSAKLISSQILVVDKDSLMQMDFEINDPNVSGALYVIEVAKQTVFVKGYFTFDGSLYTIDENKSMYDSLKALSIPLFETYDTSYSGSWQRSSFYSTDQLAENTGGTGQGKLLRRVFLKGSAIGSVTHRTRVMIPIRELYGIYGQSALTRVYIKSVAADYYEFLRAYENYDGSAGIGGSANPTQLPGNVVGGYGMIGGVYRHHFDILF